MEEEENFNYRSPKGQLIKLLEQKCKKPEIDNTLSQVLDKFSELNKNQNIYLENGIFQTNFAEDALLLQYCGLYYGKRVDKLWNDLLQLQTRLVQYDQDRDKTICKGSESRQLELEKLEERMNRSRHKKIKLADPKHDMKSIQEHDRLLEVDGDQQYEVQKPFELDSELMDSWSQLCFSKEKKMSKVLMEYSMQPYRLNNYLVPGENDIIYDADDPDEFNTKQSRLPSYHPIRHLIEYNDRCLLPDRDNTIAKLRIAYMGNQKYFNEHQIQGDASYETYKVGYEKFVRDFFERERKKIQNMPQDDLKDLHKFYEVLESKEKEALMTRCKLKENSEQVLKSVTFESLVLGTLSQDFSFEDHDMEECNLGIPQELANITVDLTENITMPADKLRSDSGYFDGGFENDDDDMSNSDEVERQRSNDKELPENQAALNGRNDIRDSSDNDAAEYEQSGNESQNPILGLPKNSFDSLIGSNGIMGNTDVREELKQLENNNNNQDFVNVNYLKGCKTGDAGKNVATCEHDYIKETKDMIMVIYNKDQQNDNVRRTSKTLEKNVTLKMVQNEQKKRDVRSVSKDTLMVKRRKLTAKQIIKLKKSLIKPVNALKWESFFSMNYRTELGEGEVVRIDYEPDFEDEDHLDYNTDCEGSHISDHDYCRPDSAIDLAGPCEAPNVLGESVSPAICASPKAQSDNTELGKILENAYSANDSGFCTTESEDNITEKCVSQTSSLASDLERERQKIKQSVADWKSYIEPKLKTLKERDFDIHKYGSDIMDSMNVNETKLFTDLVGGKSSAEVVRFFISTLQLASTCNVEICGVQKGNLSNETLSLKLLNKERYHDHLEEYQAPSEECYIEKLNKIKEIRRRKNDCGAANQQNVKHKSSTSTESVPPPSKKIKILSHRVVAWGNGSQEAQQPSTSQNHMSVSQVENITPSYWMDQDSLSDEDSFFNSCSNLSQSTPRNHFVSKNANGNVF